MSKEINYKNLSLLTTTLLIIVSSLFLIQILTNYQASLLIQSSRVTTTKNSTPKETTTTFRYIIEDAPTSLSNPQEYVIDPTSSAGSSLNYLGIDFFTFINDISEITETDKNEMYFSNEYKCIKIPYLASDKLIQFKSQEDETKYKVAKEKFFEYLEIKNEDRNSDILSIVDICQTPTDSYILVSIDKLFQSESKTGFTSKFVKQVHAGGGNLPGYDRYLLIIPVDSQQEATFITIMPLSKQMPDNQDYRTFGEAKVKVINFNQSDLPIQMANWFRDRTTVSVRSTAYFGYSGISIFGYINNNIVIEAKAGDGCCGGTSLYLVDLKTKVLTEVYSCFGGFGEYTCKNFKQNVYRRGKE